MKSERTNTRGGTRAAFVVAMSVGMAWGGVAVEDAPAWAEEGGEAEGGPTERERQAAERDYRVAVRRTRAGKASEALELFEKALPFRNTTSDIFYNLVMVAEAAKRWEKVVLYGQGFLFLESDTDDAQEIERKVAAARARLTDGGEAPVRYVFDLSPDGWEVQVDHVPLAQNRVTEVLLPPGTYQAVARKRGHHPWRQTLEIAEGDPPQVVEGELPRKIYKGLLAVKTEPSEGVAVYIDDERAGTTPMEPIELQTRRFLVRFEKEGYARWVRYVTIERDATYELEATLERDGASP